MMLLAQPLSAQSPHTHEHSFSDADKWSQVFDDPQRDAWQKPHEVIQALALKVADALVADIGAGTGYFSVRLAHSVPQGRVYTVDTEPDMVKHLAERAKRDGLTNLTPVSAQPANPKFAGESGPGAAGRRVPRRKPRALFQSVVELAEGGWARTRMR